jgi:hypothetical protein
MRRFLPLVVALVAGGLAPTPEVDAAKPLWTVIELQPLHEGDQVDVVDINDAGVSVGTSEPADGDPVPVRWSTAGVPTELELEDGCTFSYLRSISDAGHIAGHGVCEDVEDHFGALIWQPDGTPSHAGGLMHAEAIDVNGVITGFDLQPDASAELGYHPQAFAYLQGQPQVDLPDAGAPGSFAFDHTSWGYVVGMLSGLPGVPTNVAVGWYGPYLFPLLATELSSMAVAVDESGVALVVTYRDGSSAGRGYLVAPGGTTVAVGTSDLDRPRDVNAAAIVVGQKVLDDKGTATFDDDLVAGVFYLGPQSVRLDELVSESDASTYGLTRPSALNDSAWVVGDEDGAGWLLKPPAS